MYILTRFVIRTRECVVLSAPWCWYFYRLATRRHQLWADRLDLKNLRLLLPMTVLNSSTASARRSVTAVAPANSPTLWITDVDVDVTLISRHSKRFGREFCVVRSLQLRLFCFSCNGLEYCRRRPVTARCVICIYLLLLIRFGDSQRHLWSCFVQVLLAVGDAVFMHRHALNLLDKLF